RAGRVHGRTAGGGPAVRPAPGGCLLRRGGTDRRRRGHPAVLGRPPDVVRRSRRSAAVRRGVRELVRRRVRGGRGSAGATGTARPDRTAHGRGRRGVGRGGRRTAQRRGQRRGA